MSKKQETILCSNCHQPFHGLTNCVEAAPPKIKALLAQASDLRQQLMTVEQELFDLDWEHYCYITGVIKRGAKA